MNREKIREAIEHSIHYYQLRVEIANNDELSVTEKHILHLIDNLTRSSESEECFANNKWFLDKLKISESFLLSSLKSLEEKKYITRYTIKKENGSYQRYIKICNLREKCFEIWKSAQKEEIQETLKDISYKGYAKIVEEIEDTPRSFSKIPPSFKKRPYIYNSIDESKDSYCGPNGPSKKTNSKEVQKFIDEWYSRSHTMKHKLDTKAYQKALESIKLLLNKELYKNLGDSFTRYENRQFTIDDFKHALDNYELAFAANRAPKDKSKLKQITLERFLYSAMGNFSLFLKYLEETPALLVTMREIDSDVTEVVQSSLSVKDKSAEIVQASNRIARYLQSREFDIPSTLPRNYNVRLVFKFIATRGLTPSLKLFFQDWFFNELDEWLIAGNWLVKKNRYSGVAGSSRESQIDAMNRERREASV